MKAEAYAQVEELTSDIVRTKADLDANESNALNCCCALGKYLIQLKKLVGRGNYRRIAEEKCGLKKSQCAEYRTLAEKWDHLDDAIKWAAEDKLDLVANNMAAALKLLKAWERRDEPADKEHGAEVVDADGDREHDAKKMEEGDEGETTVLELPTIELPPEERHLVATLVRRWPKSRSKPITDPEHRILRKAAKQGVSVQAYLAAAGCGLPNGWTFDEPDAEEDGKAETVRAKTKERPVIEVVMSTDDVEPVGSLVHSDLASTEQSISSAVEPAYQTAESAQKAA